MAASTIARCRVRSIETKMGIELEFECSKPVYKLEGIFNGYCE